MLVARRLWCRDPDVAGVRYRREVRGSRVDVLPSCSRVQRKFSVDQRKGMIGTVFGGKEPSQESPKGGMATIGTMSLTGGTRGNFTRRHGAVGPSSRQRGAS